VVALLRLVCLFHAGIVPAGSIKNKKKLKQMSRAVLPKLNISIVSKTLNANGSNTAWARRLTT
jgi:hypothetical protein